MLLQIVLLSTLVLLFPGGLKAEDKKWVWDDNSRSAPSSQASSHRQEDDHRAVAGNIKPRYEIFEPDGDFGDYDRPLQGGLRPHQGQPPYRPNFVGGRPPPLPPQGYYPGHQGELGGRPPFIKKFDTCSCTEKFNCQSPGISYGHCDVGKSYCCFNKHGGLDLGPAPSRPIQNPANGILVGPSHGGDVGYGASRPDYERPLPNHLGVNNGGYGGRPEGNYGGRPGNGGYYAPGFGGGRPQGILVGPGGPTGVLHRPAARPIHSANHGVLVGPGGPYDRPGYNRPFGIYGRSAKTDDDEVVAVAEKKD